MFDTQTTCYFVNCLTKSGASMAVNVLRRHYWSHSGIIWAPS